MPRGVHRGASREDGGARVTQTAVSDPVGLFGLAYGYGIWPLPQLVFAGMLRGVRDASTRASRIRL